MSGFFDQIKRLFTNTGTPHQPVVHEEIVRSEDELEAYNTWCRSMQRDRLLDAFRPYLVGGEAEVIHQLPLSIIDSPSAKGFYLSLDSDTLPHKELQHFFDFLKDRVLELGYKVQVSDIRSSVEQETVKTKERHYLKPRVYGAITDDGLFNQKYGNITIEHVRLNDRPDSLSFRVSPYSDRNYTAAQDVQELYRHVLDTKD